MVFANALVPVIYESHLGGGVEYRINQSHSVALSAIGTFHAQKTEDGSGDAFSVAGTGMGIDYRGFDIDATWTIRL